MLINLSTNTEEHSLYMLYKFHPNSFKTADVQALLCNAAELYFILKEI
jgi:hypothetical protein